MTKEREQLELAAKACGIEGMWVESNQCIQLDTGPLRWVKYWNPRTDDGDCARMEAQLDINVSWDTECAEAAHRDIVEYANFEDHDGDKSAARRAASVAVASEIGRTK